MPLSLLVLVLVAGGASAQRPTDIVKWSADGPSKPVRAGAVAKIELHARVQDGWKLYALTQPKGGPQPLGIDIAEGAPFEIVRKDLVSPAPKIQKDDWFPVQTRYHENKTTFVLPVKVVSTVEPGTHAVPLEITFQACGANLCLRPFTQRLDVTLNVVAR